MNRKKENRMTWDQPEETIFRGAISTVTSQNKKYLHGNSTNQNFSNPAILQSLQYYSTCSQMLTNAEEYRS